MKILGELNKIVEQIKDIEGVLAIVLFGSFARGDYDEGSDIDLLILFEDKANLNKGWDNIIEITSKSDLFTQTITLTVDEFISSPLLHPVLREGKILYQRKDFNLNNLISFEPYVIVTYDLSTIHKSVDKVKFIHRLFGRKAGKYSYKGILDSLGGFKVGRNAIMLPFKNLNGLTEFLDKNNVRYVLRYVWLPKVKS